MSASSKVQSLDCKIFAALSFRGADRGPPFLFPAFSGRPCPNRQRFRQRSYLGYCACLPLLLLPRHRKLDQRGWVSRATSPFVKMGTRCVCYSKNTLFPFPPPPLDLGRLNIVEGCLGSIVCTMAIIWLPACSDLSSHPCNFSHAILLLPPPVLLRWGRL